MNRIIVVLAVAILSSCTTVELNKTQEVVHTAPFAVQILSNYIGEDDKAIDALVGPVASLRNLHAKVKAMDSQSSFYDFYLTNPHDIVLAVTDWQKVINVVTEYAQRTGKPIPQELKSWRKDVEKAWLELAKAIKTKSRNERLEKYANLMLRMLAARAGTLV